MSEEDLQALDALVVCDPDPAQVRNSAEAHVPDVEHVLAKSLLDFRALYVG